MKYDTVSPTLARILTTNLNIKGILNNLKTIMDSKGYEVLENKYLEIAASVPKNEVLSREEEEFESFGTDLKYGELDSELRRFENDLKMYNDFKVLSDLRNKIEKSNDNAFFDDFSLDDYIENNKQFIDLIIVTKNNKTIHQFTGLMEKSFETIFKSLKVLSLLNNSSLISYITETGSSYLQEGIGSLIRTSIDTTNIQGELDEDFLRVEVLEECANVDEEVRALKDKAEYFYKRELDIAREKEEKIKFYRESIQKLEEKVSLLDEKIRKLKLKRSYITFKRALLKGVAIPAVLFPFSCPFIGNIIGRNLSKEILLTKTITNTIDTATGKIINTGDEFLELKTDYVASVTICDPWQRNVSGTSFVRNCTVYDYDFSDFTDIDDNFHLKLEDIDPNKLIEKYTYQEPCGKVEDERYFNEKQIYITETYQDSKTTLPSSKHVIPYTVAGVGVGVIVAANEVVAYLYGGKRLIDDVKDKWNVRQEDYNCDIGECKELYDLSIKELDRLKDESNDLVFQKKM